MLGIPFNPQAKSNRSVTAGATSSRIAINAQSLSVRVVNTSANIAHVAICSTSNPIEATTDDTPILGNSSIILSKAETQDQISFIRGGANDATLQIQTGQGGI